MCVQNLVEEGNGTQGTDASGNPILKDIGMHIKSEIKKYSYFQVGLACTSGWGSVSTLFSKWGMLVSSRGTGSTQACVGGMRIRLETW